MDDGEPHQPSQQPHGAPVKYGQEVPARSDIDEILRRKRKAREYKVRMSLRKNTSTRGDSSN